MSVLCAEYQRVWDAKGKCFRDAPLHSWASHLTDVMQTLAGGHREHPALCPNWKPAGSKRIVVTSMPGPRGGNLPGPCGSRLTLSNALRWGRAPKEPIEEPQVVGNDPVHAIPFRDVLPRCRANPLPK